MGAYFRLYDHKHTPISSLLCTPRISEPPSFTPDMNTSQDKATTEQTSQMETQLAPAPFDDQTADIILISSDNVHFYVHKLLLSLVSPVFQTMFGLPSHDKQETQDGRPCLAVAEDRHRLVQLLSWCDPRCSPTLTRLEDFQIVWELADKYSMDDIMTKVKNTLASVNKGISANPLTAFCSEYPLWVQRACNSKCSRSSGNTFSKVGDHPGDEASQRICPPTLDTVPSQMRRCSIVRCQRHGLGESIALSRVIFCHSVSGVMQS